MSLPSCVGLDGRLTAKGRVDAHSVTKRPDRLRQIRFILEIRCSIGTSGSCFNAQHRLFQVQLC